MIEIAYLIFSEDFKKRNWIDWLKSHVMGAPPPHRFKGILNFYQDTLTFDGWDAYLQEATNFTIRKEYITQIYHGFDTIFNAFQTRNLELFWTPIRLTLRENEEEEERYLYLVAEFDGLRSANDQVFEELKSWLM